MTKPLIGICTDHVRHFPVPGRDRSYLKLYPQYCQAILAGGGTPLILPMLPDVNELRPLLALVRGVMLVGADDYPADWYGKPVAPTDDPVTPERAAFDRAFIKLLIDETSLPVFGVCGGMQLMAIHDSGSMLQDLPTAGLAGHKAPDKGASRHAIEVASGSILAKATGGSTEVNSLHHQAVERIGKHQRATAHAPDGVLEALEYTNHPWRMGVQWHPERMLDDPKMVALFNAFVVAAAR